MQVVSTGRVRYQQGYSVQFWNVCIHNKEALLSVSRSGHTADLIGLIRIRSDRQLGYFINMYLLCPTLFCSVGAEPFCHEIDTSWPRWVLPMASTSVWATLSYLHMDNLCWFGYNHKIYYWVSEGPRLVIIVVR